jgi:hypothetical protein
MRSSSLDSVPLEARALFSARPAFTHAHHSTRRDRPGAQTCSSESAQCYSAGAESCGCSEAARRGAAADQDECKLTHGGHDYIISAAYIRAP